MGGATSSILSNVKPFGSCRPLNAARFILGSFG
jgi:hypothetical protein